MDEVKLSPAHVKETRLTVLRQFTQFLINTCTHFINGSSSIPFITLTAVLSCILVSEVLPTLFLISLQGLAVSL